MNRFILTGTPGAGKTAILRQLEIDGYTVIEEAATDIIALRQAQGVAEPWSHPSFIDLIVNLQHERQLRSDRLADDAQFFDRSPICTYALATYLGFAIPDVLSRELDRINRDSIYQRKVFFIQNLGYVAPTGARRISFEDALRFERIHEQAYRDFGFSLITVVAARLRIG